MYRNFADVARACAQRGIGPAQLFLESECRLTERAPDEVRAQLRARWAVMEASARQALEAAGYARYEIYNYARPG